MVCCSGLHHGAILSVLIYFAGPAIAGFVLPALGP